MNITFSYAGYTKLPPAWRGGEMGKALLLQVLHVDRSDLSPGFLEYDTRYIANHGVEYYPLEAGKYLLLILMDVETRWVFTTLRSAIPKKETYYRANVGKVFDIVLSPK